MYDFSTESSYLFVCLKSKVIINTNLQVSIYNLQGVTLHRFQVIADYWSNLRFGQGYMSLTHSFGVNP